MASLKNSAKLTVFLLILTCIEISGKQNEKVDTGSKQVEKADSNESSGPMDPVPEFRSNKRTMSEGPALLFGDELKQTLERYLFGICPQTFKIPLRGKNGTAPACDLDTEQQDLAGRLATLALRAHSAARSDCSRLGSALANTLGELARTAANRRAMINATNEANKKRKLSKSQKMKIAAKQRTALAVKKKAAALAAAAAAKVASA